MKKETEQKVDIDYADRVVPEEGKKGSYLSSAMISFTQIGWFAVGGVILGAVVANVVKLGIASINGMVVAAVCYLIGHVITKNK